MIFSKTKFLENVGEFDSEIEKDWVEACDGARVYRDFSGTLCCRGNDGKKYKMIEEWLEEE